MLLLSFLTAILIGPQNVSFLFLSLHPPHFISLLLRPLPFHFCPFPFPPPPLPFPLRPPHFLCRLFLQIMLYLEAISAGVREGLDPTTQVCVCVRMCSHVCVCLHVCIHSFVHACAVIVVEWYFSALYTVEPLYEGHSE